MSTRCRLIAVSMSIVAAAGMSGVSAQAQAPRVDMSHEADRLGLASGLLRVAGSGNVVVQGRLAVSGNLPVRGVLRIVDRGRDASVYVDGERVALRRGRGLVRRARGIVFASGSNVTLQFTGVGIRLSAAGRGRASLRGSGWYRVNLRRSLTWRRALIPLAPATAALGRGRGRDTDGAARR